MSRADDIFKAGYAISGGSKAASMLFEYAKELEKENITLYAAQRACEDCDPNEFVKAVLEEREACAKVCEALELPPELLAGRIADKMTGWESGTINCAEAIRARSEEK